MILALYVSYVWIHLVHSEKIVKSIREEMAMIGIHKTSNEEGIDVKNVQGIQFVEHFGTVWANYSASQNDSNYSAVCICLQKN